MDSSEGKHDELELLMDTSKEKHETNDKKAQFSWTSFLHTLLGLILTILSVGVACISSVFVQLLERRIPDFYLNMFRYATALVCSLAGLIKIRAWPTVPRDLILATFCYSVLLFSMTIGKFISCTLLPVATVQSMIMTTRITSGILIFAVFLKEQITLKRVLSVGLCVSGVILIIQPVFIFAGKVRHITGNETLNLISQERNITTDASTEEHSSNGLGAIGYALAIMSGLSCSGDMVLLKRFPLLKVLPVSSSVLVFSSRYYYVLYSHGDL